MIKAKKIPIKSSIIFYLKNRKLFFYSLNSINIMELTHYKGIYIFQASLF